MEVHVRNKPRSKIAIIVSGLLIGCSVLFWGPAAVARPDESRCSNRTLRGSYGGSFDGQIPAGPGTLLLRGLVMTQFDGEGNLSQVEFVTLNGAPPSSEWRASQGTYEIEADCTGGAEITQSDGSILRQRWVVINRGREIRAVVEGAAAGGTRIKVD
jgi:hypothetical protein